MPPSASVSEDAIGAIELFLALALKWLGRLYSRDIFRVEGFFLRRPE